MSAIAATLLFASSAGAGWSDSGATSIDRHDDAGADRAPSATDTPRRVVRDEDAVARSMVLVNARVLTIDGLVAQTVSVHDGRFTTSPARHATYIDLEGRIVVGGVAGARRPLDSVDDGPATFRVFAADTPDQSSDAPALARPEDPSESDPAPLMIVVDGRLVMPPRFGDPITGTVAPPFAFEAWIPWTAGESPQRQANEVLVVDFWATWCAPCIAAFDKVSALQARYADQGVRVVAVTEEPRETVDRFLARAADANGRTQRDRARFSMAVDPDGSTMRALLPRAFRAIRPQMAIIDRSGRLAWFGTPDASVDAIVEQVAAGTWMPLGNPLSLLNEAARQSEQDRILRDEDWDAVGRTSWDDADFLARVAFVLAFDFEGTVANRDRVAGERFARRAIELTDDHNAFAMHSLARLRFDAGAIDEAVALQSKAIDQLVADDSDATASYLGWYRSTLDAYRSAQDTAEGSTGG